MSASYKNRGRGITMSECSSNYIAVELEDAKELKKQLEEYEKLESESEEIAEEDRVYRKKIVR